MTAILNAKTFMISNINSDFIDRRREKKKKQQ